MSGTPSVFDTDEIYNAENITIGRTGFKSRSAGPNPRVPVSSSAKVLSAPSSGNNRVLFDGTV